MKMKMLLSSFLLLYGLPAQAQSPVPVPKPITVPAPVPAPQPSSAPAPQPVSVPQPKPTAAPVPQPSPTASKERSIPVVPAGNNVKPGRKEQYEPSEPVERPKTVRKAPRPARIKEMGPVALELRQSIHSRLSSVGDEVIFTVADPGSERSPSIPRGTVVVGRINAIEKPQKNAPGRVQIALQKVIAQAGTTLPLSGNMELASNPEVSGNKETFIPVGARQSFTPATRLTIRPSKLPKTVTRALTAQAEIEKGPLIFKPKEARFPQKVTVYIEPPSGLKVSDLRENSAKLIRVNQTALPSLVAMDPEKPKVTDYNKNKIQDLKFSFKGWEIAQYLSEGDSTLVFSLLTQDGRTVEAPAQVRVEFR